MSEQTVQNSASGSSVDKAALLASIEQEWAALADLVGRLDEAQLNRPGAESWSPKDHLAHLTSWLRITMGYHLDGRPFAEAAHIDAALLPTQGKLPSDDALNAIFYLRDMDLPLTQVWAELQEAHRQVMARLQAMTVADLQRPRFAGDPRPVAEWIIGNTSDHYRDHRTYIRGLVDAQPAAR